MPNNINPTLVLGQAQAWLSKNGIDIPEHHRRDIEVRIYDPSGVGFYFVRGHAAFKWYRKDSPNECHFNNCEIEDIQAAINDNARVQIVGYRGASHGVWRNWSEFAAEVL